jgi:hypothetical protein
MLIDFKLMSDYFIICFSFEYWKLISMIQFIGVAFSQRYNETIDILLMKLH